MVFIACMAPSCSEQNSNETFIVPLDTMPVYNRTDSKMPPPPPPKRAYYFPSNFIIDTSGQVFFYQRQRKWNDDVQADWNTPPEFIDLKPKDIVEIPVNGIEEFIKLNILNIDSSKRYIAIASAKDTMTSLGLSKIIAICKDENNHIRWKFRLMTQEEAIVLNYKKGNGNYDSEEIKWDSTKIKMPAKVKTN
jgi:hypothetical protein